MDKSTILTFVAAAGVVGTAIFTAKGTTKASLLLKQAEEKKGGKLTKMETVKTVSPAYIPALIVGTSTIACIFGANLLNKRTQASLASAYALLDSSYKEYRHKVEEIYGEGADAAVLEEVAKDEYEDDLAEEIPEGEHLFWDQSTMKYFTANIDDVLQKATMEDGLECYIISTPFDVPGRWWG